MTFKCKFIFAITTICIISLAYAGNYCVGQKIGKVTKMCALYQTTGIIGWLNYNRV